MISEHKAILQDKPRNEAISVHGGQHLLPFLINKHMAANHDMVFPLKVLQTGKSQGTYNQQEKPNL